MSDREPLFPDGCTCLSYGRGTTMTRVRSAQCPIHGRTSGVCDCGEREGVTVTHSWTEVILIFGVGIEHFHDNDGSEREAMYEVRIKTKEWERLGRPSTLLVASG